MNPYTSLDETKFWKSGVVNSSPFCLDQIWIPKFTISPNCRIATAGSCFGQHISKSLAKNCYHYLDYEQAPYGLPLPRHASYGYSMYSARYGNIYTVKHLLQLAKEAYGLENYEEEVIWEKEGAYFDALRPRIEPNGYQDPEELLMHRQYHVARVRKLFDDMDVFILTLGLTEGWESSSGVCFPLAPGVLAGLYDPERFGFVNYTFSDIHVHFCQFLEILRNGRPCGTVPRILLTVSPVPLTATASDHHVLKSVAYSKAVLRAFAGQVLADFANVDYFPSYEIITNPASRSIFYEPNLRSITEFGVDTVMRHFWAGLGVLGSVGSAFSNFTNQTLGVDKSISEANCDEAILELMKP